MTSRSTGQIPPPTIIMYLNDKRQAVQTHRPRAVYDSVAIHATVIFTAQRVEQ